MAAERNYNQSTNQNTSENGHTYNSFSAREFYRAVDGFAIDQVEGEVKTALNFGSGDGENLKGLIERGKFTPDFYAFAFDIDRDGLLDTKRTLSNFLGRDYSSQIGYIHGTAADNFLPFADNSLDLSIGLNVIHLLKDPKTPFIESYRTLKPGKKIVISSTYEYDRAKKRSPTMNRVLALTVAFTRRELKDLGIEDIPNPIDYARFKEEEYMQMAKDAGFVDVKVENYETEMDREDIRAIFSYDDFLEGAFPSVDPTVSRTIVAGKLDQNGNVIKRGVVDNVFDELAKRGIEKIKRDWMVLVATKPQELVA